MGYFEIKFGSRLSVSGRRITTRATINLISKPVVFQWCRSTFGRHHLMTDAGFPAVRQHPCLASLPPSQLWLHKFATSNQTIGLTVTLCDVPTAIINSTKQCHPRFLRKGSWYREKKNDCLNCKSVCVILALEWLSLCFQWHVKGIMRYACQTHLFT
jgi:hypothetical protein